MYQYCAYGVGIHSDFKLYNFVEEETEADVFIRKVDTGLDREEYEKKKCWIGLEGNYGWVISRFAQFFVRDGKYIDIYVDKEAPYLEISAFICGWCMAFLFTQRGYSAIHCSALEFGDGCVLVSGVSGAGKSTTAMELIKRGHRYLVDDIAMIRPDDGFIVQPAFPIQKMCRDVAEKSDGKDLLFVDADKDKFAKLNLDDFCNTPKPLKGIVMLNKAETGNVTVDESQGVRKYFKVFSTLFIGSLFVKNGINEGEKYRMLKLAEKIPYIEITRPLDKDTLQEICNIIENRFAKER